VVAEGGFCCGGAVSLVAHGVTTVSTVVTSMSPMDLVHSALDVVGMIPIIGEAADLLNGVVYLAQGDLGNAALSMVSMVPIVGNTAAGARLIGAVSTAAVATVAAVRNTNRVANVVDEVGDLAHLARQAENALDATVTAEHALDTTTDAVRTVARSEDSVPVIEFSRTRASNIAENFDEAVAQGQPTRLTRTDVAQRDTNRAEALAGHQPAPAGQSLDEYPFASTVEGGAGANVRAVPVAEQNYQGGVLSGAYRHIAVGDQFDVVFVD